MTDFCRRLMSEAKLIEIATRLRALEDAIDIARNTYLSRSQTALEEERDGWSGESEHAGRMWEKANVRVDEVIALREDLESLAEACRDDINWMADEIRKTEALRAAGGVR